MKCTTFLTGLLTAAALAAGLARAADDDAAAAAKGNREFALDLYAKLRGQDGNLFFSPYSISTALVRLCQLVIGRKKAMRCRSSHSLSHSFCSRRACSRSQSQMRRCTSGSDTRLRSGRGGKSLTGTSPRGYLLPLSPLLNDQETVSQHHQHTVAVEAGPQPLVLVPAQPEPPDSSWNCSTPKRRCAYSTISSRGAFALKLLQ